MDNFAGAQEPDGICHFLVFYQTQNVVVSAAGFLFCSQVLGQISNGIPFGLEFTGIERNSSCGLRPQCQRVIHIIFVKAGSLDFFRGQVFGQLINNGADHFHVGQFFGTCIVLRNVPG